MIDAAQGICTRRPATLFDLQDSITCLAPGQQYRLSQLDFERLFGVGDTARVRLSQFATQYHCVAAREDGIVTFQRSAAR